MKTLQDELKAFVAHGVEAPRYLYKCIELEKENKKLKWELQYYKNTKAIQKGNDVSKWKPGCISYVDRPLNYF